MPRSASWQRPCRRACRASQRARPRSRAPRCAARAARSKTRLQGAFAQRHLYAGRREEAIKAAEKGIRLSPSDPRLFIWLQALAGAHYQMRHYEDAVRAGRGSWSLNRNWPHGLRYVVAGLARCRCANEVRSPTRWGVGTPDVGSSQEEARDQHLPFGARQVGRRRFGVESGDHCRGLGRLRQGGKVAQIGTKQRSADRLPGAAPGYRRQRRNSSLLIRRWRKVDSNPRSRSRSC
jgi:hypothetical protein